MGKKKGGRGSGGGRQYVTSAEDLEARNERHELAAKARAVRRAGSDDEGSDEKEEEEEKEEDSRAFQMQQMREAAVETESAKAPKPKGGVDSDFTEALLSRQSNKILFCCKWLNKRK